MSADEFILQQKVHALYSNHRSWLQRWLYRKLGNACDAADLVQDTFISVITGGYADDIREPKPFLATIAGRLVAHRWRRNQLETAYLEALAALPVELMPSPEAHVLALEALLEIDRALDGLPTRVKEAFLLAHLEELSYAQIAERLNVSTSSVKQYLTRANRQCLFALSV
ncbi:MULTISPECIES: sigma-70 family RNA polymerase sigma factor [Nitrosomonas]|uniref:Sigma factor, ECF subfamily n=1 Tax=Nitrosomonas europaea (strain ATCC 19718 / CIP 103999 / KCTC 2705 / NBRC 14298) TaxID=228410 RepID=Q82VI3_NITEU|nr:MULTISPECIES: sigma-70 family RNA polymerase sigma factor [Nitrosomonas]KXK49177.1 MAG: ECF subfamily RNA polymerase sigma factor [Nitrosomonas europaea]MBV6389590.1 putative RNA polymerase sigma factor FecI [Nitrosomonas europaea]CAD85012.1 Sigma factor, ECF subfamily [Nitrosomonas europaea ATCC 19718]SDW55855.1 RNA polymerase sigma-70 factor, ECF subfamily [Nitrosomonas europaea]SET16921.1 RNA polymerase sigma-70 factor, ECF subfamily [Nitrosomonas europaea]